MPYEDHQKLSGRIAARCAVITLSDTRTKETDGSGKKICHLLTADGHAIAFYEVIPDDSQRLDRLLNELESRADIQLIITNGGTGISQRDNTIPVIARHLTTELPGFGELFRMLSYEQIRSGAMLSRALGGVVKEKLLFALPGSTAAVELAMTKLILPEVAHLVRELNRTR